MSDLHGVKVQQISGGARAVGAVNTTVVGLVGTAPDADAAGFPFNTPVLITSPSSALVAALGATGTLAAGLAGVYDHVGTAVIVVRVEVGVDEAATLTNIVGTSVARTGIYALTTAQSLTGVKPRILAVPGWTHQRPNDAANPAAAALGSVATLMRAISFVDAPVGTVTDATAYADEVGNSRVYATYPFDLVFDTDAAASVPQPRSARLAGLRAQVDHDDGYWHSISNRPLLGTTGLAQPISFSTSGEASDSKTLNDGNVGTVINIDGWRVWGNTGTGSDPLTKFLSVQRTQDVLSDAIEASFVKWTIDRPLNGNTVSEIESSLNAFVRQEKARGPLIGGRISLNRELNTLASLRSGQLYMDVEYEPTAVLSGLTVRMIRNDEFYEIVFGSVAS